MTVLDPRELQTARRVMWTYLSTGFAIFGLMVLIGLVMRMEQAGWIAYTPQIFYSLMTLHGIGMITAVAVAAMGELWYIMRLETTLDERLAYWAWACIVAGVVAVLISVFVGQFGAAWTFLYPLPFVGTWWPSWATGAFLIGVALVTIGWMLWCTQMLGCVLSRYGGIRGALGWDYVFHRRAFEQSGKTPPPPQAYAALVAAVDGVLTGTIGMVIGVALIVHWISPSVSIDPLWAKNLTYFFGHSFANLTIYMAVAGVYVGIPRYANRDYHTSVALAVAWWGTLVFVAIAYFHHMYMDFVQFLPLQYIGEAASYLSSIPTALVTVYGSLMLVYRSRMRWSLGSLFMFGGLVGWIVGGFGAVLDATIPLNSDLHNTLWVPGHFHTYLLEGVVLFVLGWTFMMLEERSGSVTSAIVRWLVGLGVFGGGGLFLLGFYIAGAEGVPRRYAIQPAPGPEMSGLASIGVIILVIALVIVLAEGARLAALARRRTA